MPNFIAIIIALLLSSVYGHDETVQKTESGIGYQCGHRIFTYEKINEAIKAAVISLENNSKFPAPFRGLLYSDDSDYLMWPIKSNGKIFRIGQDAPGPHLIIINRMIQVVDVIVRTSDQSFLKCLRYDPSIPGPLETVVKDSNGYQCGHIFINDQKIEISHKLAIKKLGKTGLAYPRLIKYPLYGVDLKYMVWPIWKTGQLYSSGSENGGPFYIVIDPSGKFIDVVARAADYSFIKCLRDRKVESASPDDPSSKLFVQPPVSGYHCGRIFFREDYVTKAADVAAAEVARTLSETKSQLRKKPLFPEKIDRGPFSPDSILWPISIRQKLYLKGSAGKYRVVMSPDFKVLGVIIKEKYTIYNCEKVTIKSKKNHNTNNFACCSADFSHAELVKAADTACRVRNSMDVTYPAVYEGPGFDIEGPYLTYPIVKSGRFVSNAGNFRVVINTKCEVVGALFKDRGKFFKCREKVIGKLTKFKVNKSEQLIREIFY